MRAVAVAISAGVLVVSLALPGLLFAQDDAVSEQTQSGLQPPPERAGDPSGATPPAARGEVMAAQLTSPNDAPARSKQSAPADKGSAAVSMEDFKFVPATVTVNVGDDVTWTNNGQTDHTATGSSFATGTVSPGSSASETFSTMGTYSYVCDFHAQMKGTVKVVGGGESDGSAPSGNTGEESGSDDSGTDPIGSPAPSETAAVAAPDAGGTASSLPSTGQSEGTLLIVGLALLGWGALAASLARWLEDWDGPAA